MCRVEAAWDPLQEDSLTTSDVVKQSVQGERQDSRRGVHVCSGREKSLRQVLLNYPTAARGGQRSLREFTDVKSVIGIVACQG